MLRQACCLLVLATCLMATGQEVVAPDSSQLAAVRARIASLEGRVTELASESAGVARRREQLDAELQLAQARVEELELLVEHSRDEAGRLRSEAAELAREMEERRRFVARHLEMLALLGRPGPLQLLYDAVRGGDLDQAVSAVTVLTVAQTKLMQEYEELQRQRRERMAELSQVLDGAEREVEQLASRRQELTTVRQNVQSELTRLQRSQQSAESSLAEMRERADALERLLQVVASRERIASKDDIRRYRGALPWPAGGKVVQTFGRHYLPKYATYTVCNGLRLAVDGGAEVQAIFPGEVAYAQHFKGYGNMVVLDHGHGVYSLVAGLATIHVRLNQRLAMGGRLGLAPPPEEQGNLYFEIRVGEQPQDPRRWLRLGEG